MTDSHLLPPDNLRLDIKNECVWRGNQSIPLTPKAFALLRYLAERPGQLVTKDELLKAVWPEVIVSEGVLTTHIGVIRQALGDKAKTPRYIETVHRRGYRLLTPLASSPPQVSGSTFQVPTLDAQHSVFSTQHSVLVGREAELAQLQQQWERALHGERQIVFVTGEPGIGKTALVETFLERLETRDWRLAPSSQVSSLKSQAPSLWIGRGQCIEQHGAGEAYMPVLEALGRLYRVPESKRLITLLHQYAPTWLVQLPAFLNAEQREALQRQTLGATKTRMLREMAEALEAWTAEQPLILWLEDLHWSDASTLELLALLARRKEHARLLVVGSYRPVEVLSNGHPLLSLTQELHGHRLCVEVAPHLLSAVDIDAYLQQRFSVSALPTDWAQTLAQQTGGNPLFLVNIIEDMVTRGTLLLVDGCWTLQSNGETGAIGAPENLRQLIARQSARLLPQARQILEAASIAGMEFSAAAVAAALAAEIGEVEERCAELANHQQFLRAAGISDWPDGTVAARYSFLHAMYQQLWHERVTPARQVQFHLRIGERKEAAYDLQAGEIATELAVHFEQGREYRRAIHYLQQAAQNALQRSAHVEAIQHLTKGLELLTTFPDTSERAQQELSLQLALGTSLQATKGWGSREAAEVYVRARTLCRELGEAPQLFSALWGLSALHLLHAEYVTSREIAEQQLRLAHNAQNSTWLVNAHHGLGQNLYFLGEFQLARKHFEQGIALYDVQKHTPQHSGFVQDPGMTCLSVGSWVLWFLGYPEQAAKRSQEALALVQNLSHPFSLGYALTCSSLLHQLRREARLSQKQAEKTIALSTEQRILVFSELATQLRTWALSAQGEEIGLQEQRKDIGQSIRAKMYRSYLLALLAEVCGKREQAGDGLMVLAEALAWADKTGERFYEAELYRLKGELLLAQAEKLSD